MNNNYSEIVCSHRAPAWAQSLNIQIRTIPKTQHFFVTLGNLPAGTCFLPCLTGAGILGYRFRLHASEIDSCALSPVGNYKLHKNKQNQYYKREPLINNKIDWLELRQDLSNVRLEVRLSKHSNMQTAYLHCSWRSGNNQSVNTAGQHPVSKETLDVPAISQMSLPEKIRGQVCSPVSMAMVLRYYDIKIDLKSLVAKALHKPSKLYGVWPHNMLLASQLGLTSTVRYFRNLDEVARLLDLGIPVPVSISYKENELPRSPLKKTAGHVLVIKGIKNGRVYVNDPAAEVKEGVSRFYDLEAFNNAWQRHHRIGYLMHLTPVKTESIQNTH